MTRTRAPILYRGKENCCGCTACYSVCPQRAIEMVEDNEGFEYPHIIETRCVACLKCVHVCPMRKMPDR